MSIRLKFHGAARTVTGSCYLVETDAARLLVDCGMFQGSKTERELNYRAFPFEPSAITALLLTHAHIDHTGLVPKLTKHGFAGPIYCTPPTADLCGVMLPDSGFIQETEVAHLNERNRRRGLPEVEPIYTLDDAVAALDQFRPVAYESWTTPAPGIRARWWNAGHLLGSASIEMEIARNGKPPLRLLFSGDIGPDNKMLQHDPEAPQGFDFVVCESTYGGRDRFERSQEARREILAQEVNDAARRRGALLIPSFAVERTQEIVTDLVLLMESRKVPSAPIFIDSPLANKATGIFRKYAKSLDHGDDLFRAFDSELVRSTESVEDSKALNRFAGFHIVVAASGMCEAGRIRHHLRNRLWQNSTTVLLAGFQAEGSLGRILETGARQVTIMGDTVDVKAAIRKIEDYSGHADGPELTAWLTERKPIARAVFLTHGEEQGQIAMEQEIAGRIVPGTCIVRPRLDDVYDIAGDACELLQAETRPRIDPSQVAIRDSHNELQNLILDIQEEMRKAGSETSRNLIIRRLRRALSGEEPPSRNERRPRSPRPGRRSGKG
jgi:metallo-beta-lactamase family protein